MEKEEEENDKIEAKNEEIIKNNSGKKLEKTKSMAKLK